MPVVPPLTLLFGLVLAAVALSVAARRFRADAAALASTPSGRVVRAVAAATALLPLVVLAVLVVATVASEAHGVRVRLAHAVFVLGLWTFAGAVSLGATVARWRGRPAIVRSVAALVAVGVAADVTPLPRFLARLDPDAIAVSPLVGGVLVAVATAVAASLGWAAWRGPARSRAARR